MVTATTVGYGDVRIASDAGKMTAFIHIFVSVSMLAALLSELGALRTQRRQELKRGRQFLGRINPDTVLSLDLNGDGVDRFEFVVGMLTRLEFVSATDVQSFCAQFDALNTSGDGVIKRRELEKYAATQQQFAASPERSAQVAKLVASVASDQEDADLVHFAVQRIQRASMIPGKTSPFRQDTLKSMSASLRRSQTTGGGDGRRSTVRRRWMSGRGRVKRASLSDPSIYSCGGPSGAELSEGSAPGGGFTECSAPASTGRPFGRIASGQGRRTSKPLEESSLPCSLPSIPSEGSDASCV